MRKSVWKPPKLLHCFFTLRVTPGQMQMILPLSSYTATPIALRQLAALGETLSVGASPPPPTPSKKCWIILNCFSSTDPKCFVMLIAFAGGSFYCAPDQRVPNKDGKPWKRGSGRGHFWQLCTHVQTPLLLFWSDCAPPVTWFFSCSHFFFFFLHP